MTLYLDHAATSFPKAPGVAEEAARFLREDAGSAGRGGHALARRAGDAVERARVALARLLGAGDARRLALLPGCTAALNVALRGVLAPGARVLIGPEAHNAVLRPLWLLARERDVRVEEVASDDALRWDLDDLERRLAAAPCALVAVAHGSNVTGAVQDVAAIVARARAAGARVLVDAAQTAGALPLALDALDADLVAFSGHKGLHGPTGIGGLWVRRDLELPPLIAGGTGTASEREEPPRELPGALEPGTADALACAALAVAARWVREETPAALHERAAALGTALREGLGALPNVRTYGGGAPGELPIVSFTAAGWEPEELAACLDGAGACVRAGLHCAPRAHRRLGTAPGGAVRASVGPLTAPEAVSRFVELVGELTGR